MVGELTCQAECGQPVGVVRARGVLSLVTAPALRSAVQECLADEPNAVVIDLTEVHAEPDVTLEDVIAGILPFLAAEVLCLVLIMAFPIISIWLPSYVG